MTRREIVDRLEMQARRRAAQTAEMHRPMWLDDAEPRAAWQRAEDAADDLRDNPGALVGDIVAVVAGAAILFLGYLIAGVLQ